MKTIPLTQGKVALVDDADYEALSQFKWTYHREHRSEYAIRCLPRNGPGPRQIFLKMHREILAAPRGIKVDHQDGDGLNCQRYNLRLATTKQNGANRRKFVVGESKFKGVQKGYRGKWRARIGFPVIYLGNHFPSAEAAARAYDKAARERFGEFAHLNFPQ